MTKPIEPDTVPAQRSTRAINRRLRQLGFGLYVLVMYACLEPVLRDWGVPLLLRWPLWAAIVATWGLPYAVLYGSVDATGYGDARISRPAVLATTCTISATGLVLLLQHRGYDPPLLGSTPGLVAYACIVWLDAFRHARASRHIPSRRRLRATTVEEARSLADDCRRELDGGELREDERVVVALNLADAFVTLCRSGDRDDLVPEALEIVERVRTAGSAVWALSAAELLVEAMTVKALRSGDLAGYEDALAKLARAAADAGTEVPGAHAAAHAASAQSLGELGEQAELDGRAEHAATLNARAAAELEQALALSPARSAQRAGYSIALSRLALTEPPLQELDAAIRACRSALRGLALRPWADRAAGYLTLADLLTKRALSQPSGGIGGVLDALWPGRPRAGVVAALWPERSTHDLGRALLLCQRLALRDPLGNEGRMRLPRLTQLMRGGQMSYIGPGIRPIGFMYRHAFAEQATLAPGRAPELAARWASWAAAGGDAKRAAEAHAQWIESVVADARRRIFLEGKARRISHIQGRIADACTWLVAADRPCDAAVALETGRAALLSERVDRERSDLGQRLVEAGRADLGKRWRIARDDVALAVRKGFDPAQPPATRRVRPVPGRAEGLSSPEYVALARHDQLLREIAAVPGCEDARAAPTYDVLRAAAASGPLVYVCATRDGGAALIVTAAPEPAVVELPGLTSAEVEKHAGNLLDAKTDDDISNALFDQLPWLWTHAMEPIRRRLDPGALVTLVPVGALGLLPLHLAGPAPRGFYDEWIGPDDGIVFRYAPNARVLMRAEATARTLASSAEARALVVAVPHAPGKAELPLVEAEAEGVRKRFGRHRSERPDPPTVAAVLEAMNRCTIWHLACHGEHDGGEPLDSRLLLHEGQPLALRAIFARRAGLGRLAVLSACQTAIPDSALLDEVVSFPSALLQAGVAGVVAAHARVPDDATMLIVLRFFDLLARDIEPARALLRAQTWLRSATNEEIVGALGDVYEPPAGQTPDEREEWKGEQPFVEPHNWAGLGYFGA